MNQFDGLLFGNGMTLNLLTHLKPYLPIDKVYLLSVDEFLKRWLIGGLSQREERRIFSLFYNQNSIENITFNHKMKADLLKYYSIHNSNIEYYLGSDLFRTETCGYDFSAVTSVFPFLYNIWHEILNEYLSYLKLGNRILEFYESVYLYFSENAICLTTNFDRFADSIQPDHLHGKFVTGFHKCRELVLCEKNPSEFYYKCIWGWNGIGKMNLIDEVKDYNEFFDFDFFFDNNLKIDHLLIYGISFQTSGYMTDLASFKEQYKKASVGGIIDEHILLRVSGLQNLNQLKNVTFSYYNERELEHYQELATLYKIENVKYIKSSELQF